ncbi:hypothetical protein [Pelolinea submarina]|uniref:Uncharacterized protein n=1 Tax=Pelolinea submarina TaxID=913107 RepID=A0A347ZWK7_9CHLR|nr:hypothetical protein [Pelolinea submarina]REG05431.1 hypothetical protein DFR64_2832 [Pelolinea submarina]BBB49688.1 hypothetical protein Pelsub_P2919 [Pelolinea submarina]
MANKLKQLFGIDYELRDITQEKNTDAETQQLIKKIQKLELAEGNKFELYFFLLELKIEDSHFHTSPGTERFSRIVIGVNTTQIAGNKNLISFLNPDVQSSPPPEVAIETYSNFIKYSITSAYWEKQPTFSDFLAVAVNEKISLRDKMLTFSLTAHATEKYHRKLNDNPEGTVTSKNVFLLRDGLKI